MQSGGDHDNAIRRRPRQRHHDLTTAATAAIVIKKATAIRRATTVTRSYGDQGDRDHEGDQKGKEELFSLRVIIRRVDMVILERVEMAASLFFDF